MSTEADQPPLPRTVRLMEFLIGRLQLRAVPPYTFNTTLAVLAVAPALLAPRWFGTLAGSLLAMQAFVTVAFVVLLVMVLMRHDVRSKPQHPNARRSDLKLWSVIFDGFATMFLLGSFVIGGFFGPLEYAVLAGTVYIGVARETMDRPAVAELGARIAVAAATLFLVGALFRLPEQFDNWAGASGSVPAAGCYFGVMAAAEAARVFRKLAKKFLLIAEYAKRSANEDSSVADKGKKENA